MAIDGSCIDWNEAWPGCFTCNSSNWLSWADGFFYVPDKQLWVQDCSFVEIDQTDAKKASYFADFVSKQCLSKLENNDLGCDKYWVNWVDGHGCTQWVAGTHYCFVICLIKKFKQRIFYIDINGGTTSFVLSTNSSGFGYCAKCSNLDPTWLLCQSDGQWALRQGISITTGITWVDSNCATWNLTEKIWDSWAQGFVMTSSGCICKNLNNQ